MVLVITGIALSPDPARAQNEETDYALVNEMLTSSPLPAQTRLDRVEWQENILHVYLTLPESEERWQTTDTKWEAISDNLAKPFFGNDEFSGIVTHLRSDETATYESPEKYIRTKVQPIAQQKIEASKLFPDLSRNTEYTNKARLRGPITHAGRQPQGALSGVTVFASAGHGWTAGDSAWYLQRPVLLGMAEDHGNLDQLNAFVQYAFNAGATVVPLRPVGWQAKEIVLDNDDPGVTFSGTWSNGNSPKYYQGARYSSVQYRWAQASATETAVARYTPNITETDFYPIYCFAVAGSNRALQTYRVKHSGGISEITIDHRLVGNGWIYLGEYYLDASDVNYVEITNESQSGYAIIADAIRWGNGVGDIVRPGPGAISGYLREEECQRYWAQSELGNNAVGFDSDIWDGGGSSDQDDNVRAGAKMAREMNDTSYNNDRWRRIHLEFHTNASGGGARGQISLITTLGATANQQSYATILSNEIDADMLLLDGEFEHNWYDRPGATYTSGYGAICTGANGDEFDATIVELAFHDNETDAELLRDPRVRAAMGRSCIQGIIRFLHSLPGSTVPLDFSPDTPRNVRVKDNGDGNITLSWNAPLADAARGDAATGYVVYSSENGYGFGNPLVLGNVLTTTITGIPAGQTVYYRIAATNSGGESLPSEVLAVRRPAEGTATALIVNGFDRLRRQQNPVETFDHPSAYAGKSIERQIWRKSNSYDYVVQHAKAMEGTGVGFVSCANEAIIDAQIALSDYDVIVWILGTESSEDRTFSASEQSLVSDFLEEGGGLFVSGAEIGFDLIGEGNGANFMRNTLHANYASDDSGTTSVSGAGGILGDIGALDFSAANGAPYNVYSPDTLAVPTGAQEILEYSGGATAGIQYDYCVYRTVVLSFPFETITSEATRAEIMQRVIPFLSSVQEALPFDYLRSDYSYGRDCDVDLDDLMFFQYCLSGPGVIFGEGHVCRNADGDGDGDIDMDDFALFQEVFTGPQ